MLFKSTNQTVACVELRQRPQMSVCHQRCWCMSSYMQKVRLEILSAHVQVLPALYMLFVQLERVSSSAQSRGVEVKFQRFYHNLSNVIQFTANRCCIWGWSFGIRWAYVILWHGCSSHRCFRQEPSLIVLTLAPHFLKNEPVFALAFLFLSGFGCFLATPRPLTPQITGSILCFHSEPCKAPQSAITAPSQSRSFIIFATQTAQSSF